MIVLDGPAQLRGFADVAGWAISRDARVVAVEALLNGKIIAATKPLEWRRDIASRFPHYRSHGPQGFRLAPEPELLTDGVHAIVIRATDARGRTVELRTTLHVEDYRLADTGELPAHLRGSNREYQVWRETHRQPSVGLAGGSPPCISVVMPVYRPDPRHFKAAIDSVRSQFYDNWQLCICDDGSRQPWLTNHLEDLAASDSRVRCVTHTENRGIAAATNTAINRANGEYIAFLDQDDELAAEALLEVARAVEEKPADVLYSDWDRVDSHGCYIEPFFKPDWSPDLLTSMMYLAHLTVYRRAFLQRAGLCRSEFDGTQDWELALRATAQTDRIVHIPKVLYHWRLGGVSSGAFNRTCHERGRRAIQEQLQRCGTNGGLPAVVENGPTPCTFHVRYLRTEWPLVSILVPTRDNARFLRLCLRSIRWRADYARFEILIIDNGSQELATRRLLRSCGDRVLRLDMPFNHSRLNNLAAGEARGDVLVLLNDDTEVISGEWLTALVEQAMRPEVGAVGAWLFHPDKRIQHAGIVLGLGPVATPLHSGLTRDGIDRGTTRLIRNVSAVTGACLAIRRDLYFEVGGLDENELPTSFNDVDLCLRLRCAGYRIVMQPLARLVHHESATRHIGNEDRFVRIMRERWGDELARDPFWNSNLPHGRAPGGFAFHWEQQAGDVRTKSCALAGTSG
jgi:GT2 family glycosyltransferase